MKQVTKTPKILERLRKSAGDGVNLDDLAVYEAVAINTLPLRKQHPLYNKAVFERGVLVEMAERVNQESIPVQIMHEDGVLPVGRLFFAEVHNTGLGSELRVLFSVSKTEQDMIRKIDNGVVDQVSVSVLPKQVLCSECGFDFLGEESKFENIYNGKCGNGHQLGEGSVHAKLVGLDRFMELSLVGRGGAQGARIVNRDKSLLSSHLAASDVDPNKVVLQATQGIALMDMEKLIAQLTASESAKAVAQGELASVKQSLKLADEKIAALEEQLKTAGKGAEAIQAKDAEIQKVTAEKDEAVVVLKDLATKVLVAAGDTSPKVPEKVAELKAVIEDKSSKMAAFLVAGGRSQSVSDEKKVVAPSASAFRVNR